MTAGRADAGYSAGGAVTIVEQAAAGYSAGGDITSSGGAAVGHSERSLRLASSRARIE